MAAASSQEEEIMTEGYNPIVRVFGRFRAGLVGALDLDRHEVRPQTPLETLIPRHRRREVWRRLHSA
jgi:hypothetical protein